MMKTPVQAVDRIMECSDLMQGMTDVIADVFDEVDPKYLRDTLYEYDPKDCLEAAAKAMALFMINELD